MQYCGIEGVAFCCGIGPSEEDDANAALIVAAVNSCFAINPSNPLAVAEALPELVEACRELIAAIDAGIQSRTLLECEGKPGSVMSRIRAALAKIEVKP